ncbi:hypothetical protein [Jiella mangrovi]|uniref:DUF3426 domain-containing protein n=1 Tax=Jiella mangrovi TaxID=2821407 RepID=A0ABS4BEG4_9HYPH|nr:hypothetical protein [Jiella mangrovi]MBP0615152.1 hypothetical protein [Jiella mangrovi]
MREQKDPAVSRMTARDAATGATSGVGYIEGVAEVTSRRSGSTGNSAQANQPLPAFGRRRTDAPREWTSIQPRQPASPAIGDTGAAGAEALAGAETTRKPRSGHRRERARIAPGRLGLVACAFAFGLLLLPAFLVSFPDTPVAATASNVGGYAVRLDTVSASLVSHGNGRILKIAGKISNSGTAIASVPPLRIDFADRSAGLRSRTLQTSVGRLGAGQSVDFVSMIAVPDNAKGDVRVGFFGTSGKGEQ